MWCYVMLYELNCNKQFIDTYWKTCGEHKFETVYRWQHYGCADDTDWLIITVWVSVNMYKKVKWSRYRLGVAQRIGRGIALLFTTAALEGGEWSAARPGRTLPPGKSQYQF